MLCNSSAGHVFLDRCTLAETGKSPALRGFVGGRRPRATTSLYLVLQSNGVYWPESVQKRGWLCRMNYSLPHPCGSHTAAPAGAVMFDDSLFLLLSCWSTRPGQLLMCAVFHSAVDGTGGRKRRSLTYYVFILVTGFIVSYMLSNRQMVSFRSQV